MRLLEALPRWSWDPIGDDFTETLEGPALRMWAGQTGHARPKMNSKDPVEKKLGVGERLQISRM